MTDLPEPCLANGGCRSPVACGGWSYCRERNFDSGTPSEAVQRQWRDEAAMRNLSLEILPAFLVALAEAGIPPDIQEVLIHGNPSRSIPPDALRKAISAVLKGNA
jgi:hypothetical protein